MPASAPARAPTSTGSSTGARPLALERERAWQVPKKLNVRAMNVAAKTLLGHHDFTTFRSVQCQALSPEKTLDRLDVKRIKGIIHIEAQARSFLHNQVRSMVGALKLVGEGKWGVEDVAQALEARDRGGVRTRWRRRTDST